MKLLEQSQQALNNEKIELSKEKQKLEGEKNSLTTAKGELTNQFNSSQKQVQALEQSQQALKNRNDELLKERDDLLKKLENTSKQLQQAKGNLAAENEAKGNLNNQLIASQKQVKSLEQSQQVLNNEKIELSREKDDLTAQITKLTAEKNDLNTNLSNAKNEVSQTSQKLNDLQQKHAPYDKLEKLYEVFLEVKECLKFEFVKDTHSAMDLIGHVLSDSKYYVEELYKQTQQELRNKNSDKGEKLVALFDLLFECIKDKKFKRLETPSSYNSACITLYPEQSSTGNIQRVVLRGYSYNDKIMPSIVDMGG